MKRTLLGAAAAALLASSAQAAPVEISLTIFLDLDFTGTGTITYDDADIVFGDEILGPDEFDMVLTLFEGTAFEQTFTEEDDIDYPDFAILEFEGFAPLLIDIIVAEVDSLNPTAILNPDVTGFTGGPLFAPPGGGYELDLFSDDFFAIPLPAALPLSLAGLAALGVVARRRG